MPRGYVEASEQYGSQTSTGTTSSGHHYVANYVAGEPFPNPQEPNKGYKLLADVWFSYVPNLYAQQLDHPGVSCTQDRFGNIACSTIAWIYRQVGYNTDPAVPRNLPQAGDTWFTESFMVETPEQSRYTTNLTMFHKNPELPERRLRIRSRTAPLAASFGKRPMCTSRGQRFCA